LSLLLNKFNQTKLIDSVELNGFSGLKTIYSIIGPVKLKELVDSFYDNVFADERIAHLFKNDPSLIRDKQYRFLTQFFGGPQMYSEEYGHPRMRMRHLPHAIDQNAMEAWLENMNKAIDAQELDDQLKETLKSTFPKLAQHMVNR